MYMTVLITKTSYDFSLKYYELFCGLDNVLCTLENVHSVAIKQNLLYGPVRSIWVRSKSDVFLLVLILQYLSTTWGVGGVKMLFIPSKYFFRSVNICFMYWGAAVFSICKCVLLLSEPFCYCIMISFVFFFTYYGLKIIFASIWSQTEYPKIQTLICP